MLKIRMQRTGRKNDPAFRVVVAEHTIGPKSGKIVEKVGSHHPRTKQTILNNDRIKYWLSVGAQASDRIHNMLIAEGIIEGKKINVLPKKTPIVKESPAEEAPPLTEAPEGEGERATETPVEEAGKEETPNENKSEEAPEQEASVEAKAEGEEKKEN